MPSEQPADVKFEIGHVLFIDMVGYSKLLITEQSELLTFSTCYAIRPNCGIFSGSRFLFVAESHRLKRKDRFARLCPIGSISSLNRCEN
jgi:hypothetical protein